MKSNILPVRTVKLIKFAVAALIVLCALFSVLLTFGDGVSFPNWESIFRSSKVAPANSLEASRDFFRVVDVGQGDCLLFYSKGSAAMFDVGPQESSYVLQSKLQRYGINTLDLLSFSHYEEDHAGNVSVLRKWCDIQNLLLPKPVDSTEDPKGILSLRSSVISNGGKVYTARQGMVITVGNFEITVLACFSDEEDVNNQSPYFMAEIDGNRILLTGDAESAAEERLFDENLDLTCEILKVPHHGSNSSTSKEFLKQCRPDYAVISCGAGNRYGHPNDNVLQRLESSKAQLYRTDMDGDITFYFENGDIEVKTEN